MILRVLLALGGLLLGLPAQAQTAEDTALFILLGQNPPDETAAKLTQTRKCVFELWVKNKQTGVLIDYNKVSGVKLIDVKPGLWRVAFVGDKPLCVSEQGQTQCADDPARFGIITEIRDRDRVTKALDYLRSKFCPGLPY